MGTGYVRNDSSNNIADANVIDPDVLDGEFDAIVAAFSESSGHTHDGTASEGGAITKVGPGQDVVVSSVDVLPKTDDTLDLGSAVKQFKSMWLSGTGTFSKASMGEVQVTAVVGTSSALSGTTPSVNCAAGDYFTLTTSGDTTFTFDYSSITFTTNDTYAMIIDVTAGGTHTITWPASVEWPDGIASASPSSGETSLFIFLTADGGTTWRGTRYGGAFA